MKRKNFPGTSGRNLLPLGYLGLRHEEKYGGMATDTISQMIFYEELARGSCGFAMSAIMQILMGTYFIARFGNEKIKQRILVPAIKGEKIGTICFTEDQSGSDLGGTRTLATKVDGGWRINGRKQWITNGPIAEFYHGDGNGRSEAGAEGPQFLPGRKEDGGSGWIRPGPETP